MTEKKNHSFPEMLIFSIQQLKKPNNIHFWVILHEEKQQIRTF